MMADKENPLPLFLFACAFLLTLGFYTIQRCQFLFWNWDFYQHQPISDILWAFVMAVRFDLSAIALLSAIPFLLFWLVGLFRKSPLSLRQQRVLLLVFGLFHLPLMVVNLGDAEFINFLGRRYTFDALFFFREIPGKFWSLFFTYWKLNLIDFVILSTNVFLLVRALPGWRIPHEVELSWSRLRRLTTGALALVALLIASRGGLQSKPINFAHAQIFLQPMMNSLVLNSPFTFLQTIRRQSLPRDQFFSKEEMLKWLRHDISDKSWLEGPQFGATGKPWRNGSEALVKPNIVLIIVESLSLELMQEGRATPFLEELSKQSFFFPNGYANARRSIEGMGAIFAGVPSLMNEPFISSQYLTNYFIGLGSALEEEGYHTSFFHGAQNGSMYFDQFMRSAGVKHYFGKNEYPRPEDDDGTWGIWDEPFLQWMGGKLGSFPQPFFSTVFTLSSHHPYKVPAQYEGKFPKGGSEISEVMSYTDHSLRRFFEFARQQPWYGNTIFIITADHTFKPSRPEYQNNLGWYKIPIMLYAPELRLPRLASEQIVQQTDLMPTILELADVKKAERNYLGNSIFLAGDRFAVNYWDGQYLFVTSKYFMTYRRGGEFKMFSMKDPQEIEPLTEPAEKKAELEARLKAAIQYFSQGMWDNKLYYPSGR